MGTLLSFCFLTYETPRGEFWVRCVTIRQADRGNWVSHFNDLSVPLARRLAEKLCDRYGIADRAALHCGRIFNTNQESK